MMGAKEIIFIVLFLLVFGIVGEMDYADECRTDPQCEYDGWAK